MYLIVIKTKYWKGETRKKQQQQQHTPSTFTIYLALASFYIFFFTCNIAIVVGDYRITVFDYRIIIMCIILHLIYTWETAQRLNKSNYTIYELYYVSDIETQFPNWIRKVQSFIHSWIHLKMHLQTTFIQHKYKVYKSEEKNDNTYTYISIVLALRCVFIFKIFRVSAEIFKTHTHAHSYIGCSTFCALHIVCVFYTN